jgi:hypothetical protein
VKKQKVKNLGIGAAIYHSSGVALRIFGEEAVLSCCLLLVLHGHSIQVGTERAHYTGRLFCKVYHPLDFFESVDQQ